MMVVLVVVWSQGIHWYLEPDLSLSNPFPCGEHSEAWCYGVCGEVFSFCTVNLKASIESSWYSEDVRVCWNLALSSATYTWAICQNADFISATSILMISPSSSPWQGKNELLCLEHCKYTIKAFLWCLANIMLHTWDRVISREIQKESTSSTVSVGKMYGWVILGKQNFSSPPAHVFQLSSLLF